MQDLAPGEVSFVEIGSGDIAATRAFFSAVFGWPCRDGQWFQTPVIKAGLHGPDPTPQIYVFFKVPNVETAAARVRAAGGEAGEPAVQPGFGRFVNCKDPGGIQFGLHEHIE